MCLWKIIQINIVMCWVFIIFKNCSFFTRLRVKVKVNGMYLLSHLLYFVQKWNASHILLSLNWFRLIVLTNEKIHPKLIVSELEHRRWKISTWILPSSTIYTTQILLEKNTHRERERDKDRAFNVENFRFLALLLDCR